MKKMLVLIGIVALLVGLTVPVYSASTIDATAGGTAGFPATAAGKVFLVERVLDFSSASLTGTASDVFQVLKVPSNTWVQAVGLEVLVGATNGVTVDLGDGVTTDGYLNDINVSTNGTSGVTAKWSFGTQNYTGFYVATNEVTQGAIGATNVYTNVNALVYGLTTTAPLAFAMGKHYTYTDTIDLLLNRGTETLKVRVKALMVPVGSMSN